MLRLRTLKELDDGSALHFKDGKIYQSINFYKNAHAYKVKIEKGKITHNIIKGIFLQ